MTATTPTKPPHRPCRPHRLTTRTDATGATTQMTCRNCGATATFLPMTQEEIPDTGPQPPTKEGRPCRP